MKRVYIILSVIVAMLIIGGLANNVITEDVQGIVAVSNVVFDTAEQDQAIVVPRLAKEAVIKTVNDVRKYAPREPTQIQVPAEL